jgi:acetyl-CoA synthetase
MTDTSITDVVPRKTPGTQEIGFSIPDRYNASAILFDNLSAGRGDRCAVTGPAGRRTYAELAADAARYGAGLQSLGLRRGDRVLLFLDDTPAYPAALFGAIRAGLVPLLINTLTPPNLLQFYLADSSATVAIWGMRGNAARNPDRCQRRCRRAGSGADAIRRRMALPAACADRSGRHAS